MTNVPQRGQRLPDVEFKAESGERLAAADLEGEKTVLYFYPKDDTPGCTKEACSFRDGYEQFGQLEAEVIGGKHRLGKLSPAVRPERGTACP